MDQDQLELEECLEGSPDALTSLRDKYHSFLVSMLRSKGANASEAEDVLADLWGSCVEGMENGKSLLAKYRGRSSLRNWFASVAIHRLYDVRRKQRPWLMSSHCSEDGEMPFAPLDRRLFDLEPVREGSLTSLLRESLQAGFSQCDPCVLLMLRLVYVHDLTQREVGRMWAWHEAKVSRALTMAMAEIAAVTLRHLKRMDPGIELTWQDFVDLCETEPVEFLP